MNTTYRTLENRLATALRNLGGVGDVKAARAVYNDVRRAHNLGPMPAYGVGGLLILSGVEHNDKLSKGEGLPNTSIALAPHKLGGADVCSFAGKCADSCVAFAGNGMFPKVLSARLARKAFMADHPVEFFTLLCKDLDRLAIRYPDGYACRLNSFSDIRWERVLPDWFWVRFASVTFYDYTKHTLRSRPTRTIPANYSLTYSLSETTRKGEARKNIDAGRNVAVVLSVRGGKHRTSGEWRPIADSFDGVPMVDGDKDDRRYNDPAGVVVGLRRKGSLAKDSGFIRETL